MDDKAKERAVVAMQDKEKREAFFKFFRQLQSLYDILSPDAFLRPFIDDYNALAVLFAWIRQAYSDRVYVDQEFTAKTKALLQQHTQSGDLAPPTVVYEIGQSQLLALRESSADDTVKVLNLRKLLAGWWRKKAPPSRTCSPSASAPRRWPKPSMTARSTPGRP